MIAGIVLIVFIAGLSIWVIAANARAETASRDLSTPAGATLRHPRDCECSWCCDRDMARTNPIVEMERAELARARTATTEAQRAATCRQFRARGVCPDCGDQIDWEEA